MVDGRALIGGVQRRRVLRLVHPDDVVRGGEDDGSDPGTRRGLEDVPRPADVVSLDARVRRGEGRVAGQVDDRRHLVFRHGVREGLDCAVCAHVDDDSLAIAVWVRAPVTEFVGGRLPIEQDVVVRRGRGYRGTNGAVCTGEQDGHKRYSGAGRISGPRIPQPC